jgi:hypothetical protein
VFDLALSLSHGEKRNNERPASKTDPEAKLYKKGKGQAASPPARATP